MSTNLLIEHIKVEYIPSYISERGIKIFTKHYPPHTQLIKGLRLLTKIKKLRTSVAIGLSVSSINKCLFCAYSSYLFAGHS